MKPLLAVTILLPVVWAQEPTLKDAFASLPFRNIGPANPGGRVDDIAVVESDPRIMYVATAAGGVFKTENGGVTFTPITDKLPNSTVGDIAIAPSDPSIVYIGMGDKIPVGPFMNKALTLKTGQTHVPKYHRMLLKKVEAGEIDPSFVITHKLRIEDGPGAYKIFRDKKDECIKVVLKPWGDVN